MPTETLRRGGPTRLTTAGTPQAVYTPSGTAGVTQIAVRSVLAVNTASAPVRISVGVHTSATDTGDTTSISRRAIAHDFELPANGRSVPLLPDLINIGPGEVVYAVCNTAQGAVVTVTAVEIIP
jgi:hypothetical protein